MDEDLGADTAGVLQAIIESLPVSVFWKDRRLRYLGCNTRFARDAGLHSPARLIGKSDTEMPWKDQAASYQADDQRVMKSGRSQLGYEEAQTRPDGSTVWLRTSKVPLRAGNGDVVGILGIYEEITALKQAQESERRLNRAMKLLSACNGALVHAEDEGRLLTEICRLAVEAGGYRMAWVGYAEQDEKKSVRPAAESGFEKGYLKHVDITWADSERGRGPTGTCIRTGATQVNQNFLTNPRMAPWREQALKRDYRSSIALPLKDGDETFGCLTLYGYEPDAFANDEVKLLEELAGDLAYGIVTLRTRIKLAQSRERLSQSLESSVEVIAAMVESRDPYTAGHQRRVAELCMAIAREMALPEIRIQGLYLAGMIHDLGKIHIPAEILTKPGRLNEIEFALVKNHPQVGYDILKGFPFPWPIADIVLQHHERIDGSGYPQGLKGDAILIEARILAVADVLESMASHRPYREARGAEVALAEIAQGRGTRYDAGVVDACMRLLSAKRLEKIVQAEPGAGSGRISGASGR